MSLQLNDAYILVVGGRRPFIANEHIVNVIVLNIFKKTIQKKIFQM